MVRPSMAPSTKARTMGAISNCLWNQIEDANGHRPLS